MDAQQTLLIAIARGSKANVNNIGDKGHHWRVVCFKMTGLETILYVRTVAVGFINIKSESI